MESVPEKTSFSFAGESIPGLVRRGNEDNFIIVAPPARRTLLAAVSDGVGGHRHGEIVSSISCREIARRYAGTSDAELCAEGAAERFLEETVTHINRRVFRMNFLERNPYPMSSTLVILLLTPESAVMANVGDSRLYAVDARGDVRQLSTDHTLANDEAYSYLSPRNSVWATHTISRSIGSRYNLRVEVKRFARSGRERYFLCSDGVYHDLDEPNVRRVLSQAATPRQTLNRIMRAVLLRGAHDNVTAVSIFPA